MTKLVLDTEQVPGLMGRVSGDMVIMKIYAIVESATEGDPGYGAYVLDVKSVEMQDTPGSVSEAGQRASVEIKIEGQRVAPLAG